jgi:hypothetical protein
MFSAAGAASTALQPLRHDALEWDGEWGDAQNVLHTPLRRREEVQQFESAASADELRS